MVRIPKRENLKVQWIELDKLPVGLGHGVEFHSGPGPEKSTLLAFIDGYDWLHGRSKVVSIFIRKPDKKYSRSFMTKVRRQIDKALESGELQHGPLAEKLFAWFNA